LRYARNRDWTDADVDGMHIRLLPDLVFLSIPYLMRAELYILERCSACATRGERVCYSEAGSRRRWAGRSHAETRASRGPGRFRPRSSGFHRCSIPGAGDTRHLTHTKLCRSSWEDTPERQELSSHLRVEKDLVKA